MVLRADARGGVVRASLLIAAAALGCATKLPDDDRVPLRDGASVRNVAPMAGARVQSRRPRVRWRTDPTARPVVLEFCRDRACASVITSAVRAGGAGGPDIDLPYGPVFWRVRDPTRAGEGSVSPAWWLSVPRGARGAERETLSWRTKTAVDADGDGRDDVVAPDGYVRTGPARGASLGRAGLVYEGGDVDGDGFPELVLSIARGGRESGEVLVYRAPLREDGNEPAWRLTLGEPGDLFGAGVASGDFNGDGFGDLAVGAPGLAQRRGAVLVYPGSPRGLLTTLPVRVESPFGLGGGFNALAAGDLDRDGRDDLLAGASYAAFGLPGVAVVYAGPSLAEASPLWTARRASDGFATVGVLGDVTGDGVTDAVLNALSDRGFGCLRAFDGGAARRGVEGDVGAVCASPTQGIQALRSFLAMGDFNGDGALDVAAEVYDVLGNASPMVIMMGGWSRVAEPRQVSLPQAPADPQRTDVPVSGDFDGDGYADLVSFGFYRGVWRGLRYRGGAEGLTRAPDPL